MKSPTVGWSFFLRTDPAAGDPRTTAVPGRSPAVSGPGQAPPAPPEAAALFGPALDRAERYAGLLAGPAVRQGIIGPRETGRLWDRHLLNCAAVAELVPHPCSLIDLGSGAGLPGVVLAMLLPDIQVVLLEPMARRVAFLEECVRELGLGNAEVWRGRAEDAAGQLTADVVTARAVAPMERLAGLALGLVRSGGLVLAVKGAGAAEELERARPVLRRAGARDAMVVHAGSGRVDPPPAVIRLTAGPGNDRSEAGSTDRRDAGSLARPGGAGS